MPRKPKVKCPMPDSPDAWIAEIAEAYVDAMGTIEHSHAIKQPMTEDAHLLLAAVTMLKARGIELSETNIQQATIERVQWYGDPVVPRRGHASRCVLDARIFC